MHNSSEVSEQTFNACYWVITYKDAKATFDFLRTSLETSKLSLVPKEKKPAINNCFSTKEQAILALKTTMLAKPSSKGGAKKGFIVEINETKDKYIDLFNPPFRQEPISIISVTEYGRDPNGKDIKPSREIQSIPAQNDKEVCFICDQEATTVEHIIPQWLQRLFDLKSKSFKGPNGRSLNYSHATIPACEPCNSRIWGPLEQKISRAPSPEPTETDIWLWACKIHYGMNCNDERLAWAPGSDLKISDIFDTKSSDPFKNKQSFLQCLSGQFKTDPMPFGSVFTFHFPTPQPYHFVDMKETSSLAISIGKIGYVVFINDGQFLKPRYKAPTVGKLGELALVDMLFFYADTHYFMHRHGKSGYDYMLVPQKSLAMFQHTHREPKPFDPGEFQFICQYLGFKWVDEKTRVTPTAKSPTPLSDNQTAKASTSLQQPASFFYHPPHQMIGGHFVRGCDAPPGSVVDPNGNTLVP